MHWKIVARASYHWYDPWMFLTTYSTFSGHYYVPPDRDAYIKPTFAVTH